jgi:C4-dicarboxylate transporter
MKEEDSKQWDNLFVSYLESNRQFDKNTLYISSGALGLSISFISDIVKLTDASYKWILGTSWTVLTIVILFSLMSHYFSMKAINSKMENLHKEKDEKSEKLNKYVRLLNLLMLIGLPIGIISLVVFIILNI